MKTNWTTPRRNVFAAINDLRKALAAGYRAILVRIPNRDCEFPIKTKQQDHDFRNYEFRVGYAASIKSIMEADSLTDFEKELSTNYVNRYGTPEAVEHYYETRELSADNDKGMGTSHLVHIEDYLEYLKDTGQHQRERMYRRQYYPAYGDSTTHFFDFYKYKHGSPYAVKDPDKLVWTVGVLEDDEVVNTNWLVLTCVGLLNFWLWPLKYVPKRSVLKMDSYKVVTYRVGSVTNGLSIDLHIPKKFSLKN